MLRLDRQHNDPQVGLCDLQRERIDRFEIQEPPAPPLWSWLMRKSPRPLYLHRLSDQYLRNDHVEIAENSHFEN